jgi:hypothetical protein
MHIAWGLASAFDLSLGTFSCGVEFFESHSPPSPLLSISWNCAEIIAVDLNRAERSIVVCIMRGVIILVQLLSLKQLSNADFHEFIFIQQNCFP